MSLPRLRIREAVLERVLLEVKRSPDVEIGGRLIGHVLEDGFDVLDFIPTGPEPDIATDIELLPDRRYQLWTLDALLELDDDLAVFGSWHSHIPNRLARFSGQDHRSYAGKMQPPYPYDGMVCGLIHEAPSSVEDVRRMLRFAWFPAQGDVGEHTYWAEDAIEWTSSPISKDMGALLHLTDRAAYEHATGRRRKGLDDYAQAIDHIGRRSGGPHPRLAPLTRGRPPAAHRRGRWRRRHRARSLVRRQREAPPGGGPDRMDAALPCCKRIRASLGPQRGCAHRVVHLSPALVEQLMPNLEEKKGGFFARLFGR